jgi:hypothetical protein
MATFDFNSDGSNSLNNQAGKRDWTECYEHHGHRGDPYRNEELPITIDFGVSSGAYNSSYYNSPAYAGAQGGYYRNGYGDNSSVIIRNAANAVAYGDNSATVGMGSNSAAYGGYRSYGDNSVTVGDARNYAYGVNATGWQNDAGGYGDKYGRLGYLAKTDDKYANVPIDQIPDDGRATEELNRRELVRIKHENAVAQTQYQPGMSHNRWMHSSFRVCANDNEAVDQQGGYQKPYWWQRSWQG